MILEFLTSSALPIELKLYAVKPHQKVDLITHIEPLLSNLNRGAIATKLQYPFDMLIKERTIHTRGAKVGERQHGFTKSCEARLHKNK